LEQLGKELNLTNSGLVDTVLKARHPTYFQAKQELDDREKLREHLGVIIQLDKADVGIPINPLVTIVNPAVTPKVPIGPGRWLGGVLLVCGVVIFCLGFKSLRVAGKVRAEP
jgi:hypothetical protein